jgi:hypothetical protein
MNQQPYLFADILTLLCLFLRGEVLGRLALSQRFLYSTIDSISKTKHRAFEDRFGTNTLEEGWTRLSSNEIFTQDNWINKWSPRPTGDSTPMIFKFIMHDTPYTYHRRELHVPASSIFHLMNRQLPLDYVGGHSDWVNRFWTGPPPENIFKHCAFNECKILRIYDQDPENTSRIGMDIESINSTPTTAQLMVDFERLFLAMMYRDPIRGTYKHFRSPEHAKLPSWVFSVWYRYQ